MINPCQHMRCTRLLLMPSWWAPAPLLLAGLLMGGIYLFRPRPEL
jgi:hypothetical protein